MPSPAHHTPLTEAAVATIADIKESEASLLAWMAKLSSEGADARWLSIARTNIQIGFMSFVRAIAEGEAAAG